MYLDKNKSPLPRIFCEDPIGEADAFFEIVNGKLKLITTWDCNDALWREEYMDSLLAYAGVRIKSLPEKYHNEALRLVAKNFGYTIKESDYEPEYSQLYFRRGTSDKVYNIDLDNIDEGWFLTVEYGRRNGTLKTEMKCEGEDYETAKKLYDKVLNEKLNKGYKYSR